MRKLRWDWNDFMLWSRGNTTTGLAVFAAILVVLTLACQGFAQAQTAPADSFILPVAGGAQHSIRPAIDVPAPPRVLQAQRFLARRGWSRASVGMLNASHAKQQAVPHLQPSANPWQALGPAAVSTPGYGLVTGRVSALALDPADPTGNHLYLGTTGGGVWVTQNAAVSNPSLIVFEPLTDNVTALSTIQDGSLSIGALSVQPGGTGVILAGTGDPNDALDSYYGAGILRSADGGNTWSVIQDTSDHDYFFTGEGFAGFAWSTANSQLVVAAVSQAYEGTLVNAPESGYSYEGLYYSADGGATWSLATITDGPGAVVQGAGYLFDLPDGNAATSVVWNPVRQMFIAAVRFHGYYQSTDGVTFTRMAAQPASGLTKQACPANPGQTGSVACPLFRGTLAVNPQTGDTFAWTVDLDNQDQGIWQDACAISNAGVCTSSSITFAKQWNTTALETGTTAGAATIANGDYNLTLAAVPFGLGQGEDTWLLAGANDLWKCSLAMGCVWRNTTNSTTCMSGQVAEFQHALAWDAGNPLEILVGNDGGLWRSEDAIAETGPVCSASDATHFQNLNAGLGSLAEVESMAGAGLSQYTVMAGLGVNGTAGTRSTTGVVADWPQILGGDGGPVAMDPGNADRWFVNNQPGVSIYLCNDPTTCTPAAFGNSPVVDDADVGGDGDSMTSAAPFLVDPLDSTQLLIGTCRVWRGPANGAGWNGTNAISPMLDSGSTSGPCSGDALIRSIAALPLTGGGEVIYAGLYGTLNGSQILPGHVFSATFNPQGPTTPVWKDLTLDPVTNSPRSLNQYGLDISSIFVDSHDPTGQTVYLTVEGFANTAEQVQTVYGSTDGGAHWASLTSNLPSGPVSGVLVDPQSAETVYLATDEGVYFTTQVSTCATLPSNCWSVFGTGLPKAPVIALTASSAEASAQVLTAGTYGRGIWQTGLASAGLRTTATVAPNSLTFPSQTVATSSSAQTVTLTNTGSASLTTTAISVSGDFAETDNCQKSPVAPGGSCTIQVTFTPTATGSRGGQMTLFANVSGGQLAVSLVGEGTSSGTVTLTPGSIGFGPVPVGTTSAPLQATATNTGLAAVPITGFAITGPFSIASNACGTSALAADSACQLTVAFTPSKPGAATGTLTLTDGAGTQFVQLSGTGEAPPTDTLSPTSLSFPATATGQLSAVQTVQITNSGDLPLTSIAVSASAQFQSANNCTTQLAAHSSCTLSVVFAPAQVGTQTGALTVSDLMRTQTVALSGIGVLPAKLTVNPTSLTFPSQNLGVPSAPMTLTINNPGGISAANPGFQISGAGAASFATGTTTCGAALASGGSCTVQVIFTPVATGGSQATLTISSSTNGVTPVEVPLGGSSQAVSGLNATPAQVLFAATPVGATSNSLTVAVSNTSAVAAGQLSVTVSGPFTMTQNTCPATLEAGASCVVSVAFAPTATGTANGTLIVSSPAIANAANVLLSGTGTVAAGLQVSPTSITFITTGVGQASSPTVVTVTNSGSSAALNNLALVVPAGFQLVNNTCTATLAPGLSCTVGVDFAPQVAGSLTGNLTVTSSSVSTPISVALAGMGFDFTVTASGSSTKTVAAGTSATYAVVITPLGNSAGTFTYACSSLPANALCVFSPATETLSAGVTGNLSVQISTGSATAAIRPQKPEIAGRVVLACVLLLLPLGWRRRRKLLYPAALMLLLALMAGGVTACTKFSGNTSGGGTTGGGGGGGTTAPGTYSILVTVTSTGISHSATVSLTVD